MSDPVVERFERFVAAFEAGERTDPSAVLADAPEQQREALGAMLAAYLAARPLEPVDDEAVLRRASRVESEPPRPWAELVPALRAREGITRSRLVEGVAIELGYPGQAGEVEPYVHGLETGQLEPRRVRPPVVAAFARVLHAPVALLEAGRRLAPPAPPLEAAYMRDAVPSPTEESRAAPPSWDAAAEIHDLFTGGDG